MRITHSTMSISARDTTLDSEADRRGETRLIDGPEMESNEGERMSVIDSCGYLS